MSIQSEITRITNRRDQSFQQVAAKGVTVPAGSTIDDLPDLIAQISTGSGSAVVVTEEPDSSGGVIKNITAVDLGNDTVDAAHLLQGYTAHDRLGQSVTGTYVAPPPTLQSKSETYTPTESTQTDQIYPDTGFDGLEEVLITVDPIPSDYVGSGITRRSSRSMAVSGPNVSAPPGYYEAWGVTSVQSGTEGTPTATKGSVSNHSVTVTPSVTNSAGYITGGTQTGTAVTVTASELVSGSQTITSNGQTDVTNLASVTVAVPIVTYYTGSSAPASSLGQDGDIYLQS